MEDEKFMEVMTQVAEEITTLLVDGLKDERGLRAEDVITAAAALAGCFLLKDSNVDFSLIEPGSPISVPEIDELGPKLLTLMQRYATGFGLDGESGWDTEVPAEHHAKDETFAMIARFEPKVANIFEHYRVPPDVRAGLMALTAIRFVAESKEVLPEDVGKSIALGAMMAGTRVAPPVGGG